MSNVAGKIIPRPMGDYSATVTYSFLDMVTLDNKLYIARQSDLLGVSPTDTSKWALLIDGKTDVTALETTMNQKFIEVNDKVDNIQVGGRNLIWKSRIVNSNCTTFTYDEATNTWDCVAAPGSNAFGYGFKISSGRNLIIPRGRTFIVSLEVKPDIDIEWWFDANNSFSGNTTSSNDNDDMSKRKNSSRSLVAGRWTKVWFSYTAKEDTDYELFDSGTIWGIVTTDCESDVHFQFRNVMGELATIPSEYTPAPEDVEAEIDQQITAVSQQVTTVNSRVDTLTGDPANYSQLNPSTASKWGFTYDDTADGRWYTMKTIQRDCYISNFYDCLGGETFKIEFEISTSCQGDISKDGSTFGYTSTTIGLYGFDSTRVPLTNSGIVYAQRVFGSADAPQTEVSSIVTLSAIVKSFRVFIQTDAYENFSGTIKVRNISVSKVRALEDSAANALSKAQEALDKATALEAKLNSLTMTINTTTGNLEWRVDE